MSGRCLAADRCRAFDRTEGAAVELGDWPYRLCEWCLDSAERDIPALLLDYRDLENLVPPSLGEWSEGGGSRERGELPVPVRENVDALQREIWWVTGAWADVLADRGRLPGVERRVRGGYAVQWATRIIGPRVRDLAAVKAVDMWTYPPSRGWSTVDGAQGLVDMSRLHSRARNILGLTRPAWSVPGTCPRCDRGELVRDVGNHGTDTVTCGHCGDARPYSDYERYIKNCLATGHLEGAA